MGFCIWLLEVDVRIPLSVHDQLLEAIKELHRYRPERAGEEPATTSIVDHKWVDSQEVLKAKNLGPALAAWRWEPSFDPAGNVANLRFRGKKAGDDHLLFDALAPFAEDGSFLVIEDEDGAIRRWVFTAGGYRVELLKAMDPPEPDSSWRSQIPS